VRGGRGRQGAHIRQPRRGGRGDRGTSNAGNPLAVTASLRYRLVASPAGFFMAHWAASPSPAELRAGTNRVAVPPARVPLIHSLFSWKLRVLPRATDGCPKREQFCTFFHHLAGDFFNRGEDLRKSS
jgi:hypothetical protein